MGCVCVCACVSLFVFDPPPLPLPPLSSSGYMNTDLVGIMASLIPTPLCHFLVAGYTPLSEPAPAPPRPHDRGAAPPDAAAAATPTPAARPPTSQHPPHPTTVRKTTVLDVMRRLLHPKNILVSLPPSAALPSRGGAPAPADTAAYLAALHVVTGASLDPADVHKSLARIRDQKLARFADWAPAAVQVALARPPPYGAARHRVSGLMLANHTGVRHLLSSTVAAHDKLIRRRAFLDRYAQHPLFHTLDGRRTVECLDEFDDAREVVVGVAAEYEAAEAGDYVERLAV